jgi:hypothetical protein
MKENTAHKFWREYEELNILDRQEKLNHIADSIIELCSIKDKKFRKKYLRHAVTQNLMGLFDDLIEYKDGRKK